MPDDNKISAVVSAEAKQQILTKIDEIFQLLPFLVNLTPDDKRGMATIGTERLGMDVAYSAQMFAHPELVPSYVDMAELGKDRALFLVLAELSGRVKELLESLTDTSHVTGSDLYMAYMTFYANVQQAERRNVPGATAILQDLQRFIPRGRRRQPESPPASS
jgi:hypothetical protein